MNGLLKKKLNLLVHIAKVDGDFHDLEREIVSKIATDLAVDPETLATLLDHTSDTPDLEGLDDRDEILYLSLLMIQADRVITDEELLFCKGIAAKLGFPKYTVDRFAHIRLPSLAEFQKQLGDWITGCNASS